MEKHTEKLPGPNDIEIESLEKSVKLEQMNAQNWQGTTWYEKKFHYQYFFHYR